MNVEELCELDDITIFRTFDEFDFSNGILYCIAREKFL